jgi:hypothetical protein
MASAGVERGAALVERVIEGLEQPPTERLPRTLPGPPRPLAPAALARLTLAGGKPLPPSLRRWLAYDTAFVQLFADPEKPELRPLGFRQLLRQEFGGFGGDAGWEVFDELLPGTCYLLPGGSDARRFLYVGEADGQGEYPVMCVDTHDIPFVCVYSPGFDVWLAEMFRKLPGFNRKTYTDLFDHPPLAAAMIEQARRNFGGYRALDENGSDTSHLDGNDWLESTGVGGRSRMVADVALLGNADVDLDDEETMPGNNPFSGMPSRRRNNF